MILAIVQIPLGGPARDLDLVTAQSVEATRHFHDVPGLTRKYFLTNETGGAGVYVFESRETAEAWFDAGWADWMERRFGVRPTLALYECPVVLDNVAGDVRVDGKPVDVPWQIRK